MDMKMTIREKIGLRIKEIRIKKNITQEQLSDMSGMNRTTISKIEAGKFNASIDLINKLTNCLGAELDINEIDYTSSLSETTSF